MLPSCYRGLCCQNEWLIARESESSPYGQTSIVTFLSPLGRAKSVSFLLYLILTCVISEWVVVRREQELLQGVVADSQVAALFDYLGSFR